MASEFSSQGWNRYSYVGNNPLAYTDPSGMCFLGCFFKRIFHSPIFRPLVAIAAAATFNFEVLPAIEAPAFAASTTGLVVNGVIGGAVGGAISGDGNPQAILAGAFTAGAFGGLNAPSLSLSGFDKVAAFGVAGGIGNAIGGGNFQSGFLAAAATTLAMPNLPNFGPLGDTLEVATVGGTASVIGGGRFANGALTAAFAYLASPGNLGGSGDTQGLSPDASQENSQLVQSVGTATDDLGGLEDVPILGQMIQAIQGIGNQLQAGVDYVLGASGADTGSGVAIQNQGGTGPQLDKQTPFQIAGTSKFKAICFACMSLFRLHVDPDTGRTVIDPEYTEIQPTRPVRTIRLPNGELLDLP